MRFLQKVLCSAVVAATAVLPVAAVADDVITSYYVELGPQDFYNSSGVRLRDGAAIFQQDRANYHRFGLRHGGDSSDPVFGSRDMRAQIPALLARGNNAEFLRRVAGLDPATAARTGFADYLVVLCGRGGAATYMFINWADGDGYDDC